MLYFVQVMCSVAYEDGDTEPAVALSDIRPVGDPTPAVSRIPNMGDTVEANFKGKGRYFPGEVIGVAVTTVRTCLIPCRYR